MDARRDADRLLIAHGHKFLYGIAADAFVLELGEPYLPVNFDQVDRIPGHRIRGST